MEFGKITTEELEQIESSLPPDNPDNLRILNERKDQGETKFYIGCAKWGRKDWVGKIYPEKTKEADFLEHYGRHFNSIELNASFYKIPSRKQTEAWASKVGSDFQFCPKFSQSITHIRRLKNAREATDRFIDGVSGFGNKLGPLFLMPHPGMGPKGIDTVQEFIENLPKEFKVFVELRHPDWYSDSDAFARIYNVLQKNNVGLVITDALGRTDCKHMRITVPETFIRFVGNNLHPSDYVRADQWVERIKSWKDHGMQRIYFFMHQQEEVHSPEMCKYFIEQLNKAANAGLKVPEF